MEVALSLFFKMRKMAAMCERVIRDRHAAMSLGLRSIEDFLHYVGQPRTAVLHARRTAEGGCPPRYRETSSSVGCGTSFVDEARTRWMASARASASFSRSSKRTAIHLCPR